MTAYHNALLRSPDQAKAWYNLAEIHLQMALQVYVEAEKHLHPDDPLQIVLRNRQEKLMEILAVDVVEE